MATVTFSRTEALRFGWEIAKANLRFFIPLLGVMGFVIALPQLLGLFRVPIVLRPFYLASYLVGFMLPLALVRASIKLCDRVKPLFADVFSPFRSICSYLWADFLLGIAIVVVIAVCALPWTLMFSAFVVPLNPAIPLFVLLMLAVVPGYLLFIRYGFFIYFIVDRKCRAREALRRSYTITEGNWWNLTVLHLLLSGINILGVLCFLVGVFVTIPMTSISLAFIYRKLLPFEPEAMPV